MTGVEKAINSVGGMTKLAAKLGITYEAVRLWKNMGVVPQGNCFDVEDVTGVPVYELNPSVYPIERLKEYYKQAS